METCFPSDLGGECHLRRANNTNARLNVSARRKIAISLKDNLGHLLQEARLFEESLEELQRRKPKGVTLKKSDSYVLKERDGDGNEDKLTKLTEY